MPTTPLLGLPYPALTDTADVPRDVQALATALDNGAVPTGALMMWLLAAAPAGWLLCLGQTNIAIATYPKLAALLGNTGGFINMPDLQGRVPLGSGTPAGNTVGGAVVGAGAHALLEKGGHQGVLLTAAQSGVPAHGHGNGTLAGAAGGADHSHGYTVGATGNASRAGLVAGTAAGPDSPETVAWGAHTHGGSGASTGGASAWSHGHSISGAIAQNATAPAGSTHENQQPYLALNFIIRAL